MTWESKASMEVVITIQEVILVGHAQTPTHFIEGQHNLGLYEVQLCEL